MNANMRIWMVMLIGAGVPPAVLVAQPASTTATGRVTLTVPSAAVLSLSAASISFPDADPDMVTRIPASTAVIITAKARSVPGAAIILSVAAADDLLSEGSVIPASALSWTATGTGFVPGTLLRQTAVTVGAWTSAGSWTGVQTYALANSWTYAAGLYSLQAVYTLVSP